jgi:HTH-type transcriptional regulator / antitoxin HipB
VINTSLNLFYRSLCDINITMKSLQELGNAVATRRKDRDLTQAELARQTGLSRELVTRLERGQLAEFGARKLLALLAALDLEMTFVESGTSGSLDELRRERSGA